MGRVGISANYEANNSFSRRIVEFRGFDQILGFVQMDEFQLVKTMLYEKKKKKNQRKKN